MFSVTYRVRAISLKALIFGLPDALPRQDDAIQEMKMLAVNLVTSIAISPPADTGASGAPPGSFALEVRAWYQGNGAPDPNSKACSSMNGKKQPVDSGKQDKTGASGDIPIVLAMRDWAATPDQSRGTPNGGASNTSDSSASGRVSDVEACSAGPQTMCPSEITSNGSAASLPGSPGLLPTAQDSAIPGPIWSNSGDSTQVLPDGVDELIPQLESVKTAKVGPLPAGTPTDPTVTISPSTPGISKAAPDPTGEQPASTAKSGREGAQPEDAPTPCHPAPSGTEAPPRKADPSSDSATAVPVSSTPPVSDQASDKAKDPGPAASCGENTATPGATVAVAPGCTQTGGDSNSDSDETSQDAQDDSKTAATAFPLKVASLASVGPKVGPPKADTSPEMVIGTSEPARKSSDAPSGTAASSTGLAGPADPAPQAWEGVREHLGQVMSSAYLVEGMGQSELQVDMKSDPWGPVSVRAILSNGQFGAEIQVMNRDAHAALTEGLNGLEKALGDKGIQVVSLGVSHGLGYGHSESQEQRGRQAMPPLNSAKGYTPHSAVKTGSSATATTADNTEDFVSRRVSVRA